MAILCWSKRENIFKTNFSAHASLVNYHGNRPLMSGLDKLFRTTAHDKLAVLGGDAVSRFWFAMRESMENCVDVELESFSGHFRELGHLIIRIKN